MRKTFDIKNVDKMKFSKRIAIKTFVLYIAVLCLGCFSVLVFVRGLNTKKEYDYKYEEKNLIDYKVYLKENNYFEEEYLEKGNKYIASLIKDINVTFDYIFSSQDIIDGKYNYYVTATLEAKEKGKEIIIWNSKEEILFQGQEVTFEEQEGFQVSPNVTINYEKYNAIMNEFKSAYGVALDGSLVLTLHVDTDIEHEKSEDIINNNAVSSLRIPLITQTLEIELDYNDTNTKTSVITYIDKPWLHYVLVVCGIILFIYYLYLSVKILKLIFDIYNKQDKYQKRLKKIFNNYDQVIVKVNKIPSTKGKSLLDVENFDELLDAQSELREPILYNEVISKQESVFIVIKDERAFRYVIKYTDFVK